MKLLTLQHKIANAFAGIFAFLPTLDRTQKIKRACKQTHGASANLTRQTFDRKEPHPLTAKASLRPQDEQ
jgi:hypothetical protein